MTIEPAAVQAVQHVFWMQAEALMFAHTNPWELDAALCDWGYAIGPCEAQDLMGLEKVLSFGPDRPTPILARMLAEGRIGKRGSVGYYRYPGGGGAVTDPLVEDLILEEAWFAKTTRSTRTDGQLVDAMHAALLPLCRDMQNAGMSDEVLNQVLSVAVHYPASIGLAPIRLMGS
ncbi:MAG: hypothetical protein ABJL67_06495 [Sulfitobacter sp.]